ncbi:phosphate acyltransferase PlsX [Rhodobacteraceae bacterium 2CG4]|uniref:Phosphate acyltransferase n=1 Tax=Halovulum marinum TaxID=2662447 RepID=A0A6L5Z165_9RHOB|nr:phosphate acyltransferase PlsX [Halovulum marinum]MSU89795.1 phosphate acyltransferase PlsX [Halovulum marinum]
MTASTPDTSDRSTVISIDAMGGERGLSAVIGGMEKSARKNPDIRFILHGPEPHLAPLLQRQPALRERTEVRHVEKTVSMEDKPSRVLRRGKGTSMWNALESVAKGEAAVAVSCGNTGALMALSMLALRKAPGVDRPAIAVMWPSRNPSGYNVVLDVGADIRADARDLLNYAIMGAAYVRNGLQLKRPRVGLLNVGTEEHKGRPELHEAAQLIEAAAPGSDFEYVGYVEGSDIGGEGVDLIVTDGFTGNVALKTAEGTAMQVRDLLKEAFRFTPLSRIGALFALTSLRRLSKRIDPRRVNGGVFLGLNGTVVKSHGSADATGLSAAIKLAFILAQNGFAEKLARRVASGAGPAQTDTKRKEAEAS